MKTLALIIEPNQNEVSKGEINKIRRSVRKFYPASDYKINVYANNEVLDPINDEIKEDKYIIFYTSDVNYDISAHSVYSSDNLQISLKLS